MTVKRCTKCGHKKPATLDFFDRLPKARDGFRGVCKDCRSEGIKEYYDNNRESRKAGKLGLPPEGAKKTCQKCRQEKPATTELFAVTLRTKDGLDGYCRVCRSEVRSEYKKLAQDQKPDTYPIENKKRCTKCKVEKPATPEFFQHTNISKDGLAWMCKDCKRGYYESHKEKSLAVSSKWRIDNPKNALLNRARGSSKRRGYQFSITIEDIPDIPEFCPILGIRLESVVGNGHHRPSSPSLDRIDSTKGYVPGNLQITSWRANDLKGNGTLEEFKKLVVYLQKQGGSVDSLV